MADYGLTTWKHSHFFLRSDQWWVFFFLPSQFDRWVFWIGPCQNKTKKQQTLLLLFPTHASAASPVKGEEWTALLSGEGPSFLKVELTAQVLHWIGNFNIILIALVFTLVTAVFGYRRLTTVPVDVKSLLLLVLAVIEGFQLYLNLLPSL